MSGLIMGLVWELPFSKEFTAGDKFVALAYADHAWQDGTHAYPSIALVAEKTGYSERAVQRHVRQLEKLGLLVLAGQGQHGTNSYDFPLTKRPDGSPYLSIQASQGCQNVTPDKMTGVTLVTPEEMSPEEMSPKPKEVLKDLVVVVKDDPKEKNVFAIYESNFGAMTSMLKDSLIDLEKTYSAEWLIAAMQEALLAEARNLRYVEAVLYQSVAENIASEQSARMVAMKSASDNAKNVIGELKLVYNKARQAAITKELSEIVSGAAAV